jgi:hypothetical protein
MTAELAHKGDTCGSCGHLFKTDDVLYRTRARLIRCKGCAEKITPQLPEVVLTQPPQVKPLEMPRFTAFGARKAWKVVREDWRQKAAGGE